MLNQVLCAKLLSAGNLHTKMALCGNISNILTLPYNGPSGVMLCDVHYRAMHRELHPENFTVQGAHIVPSKMQTSVACTLLADACPDMNFSVFRTSFGMRFLTFAVAETLVGFNLYGVLVSPYHIAEIITNMSMCPVQSLLLVLMANKLTIS